MARSEFDGQAEPSKETLGEYPVTVIVYQADGSTPRPNAVVKLTNERTRESSTKTADSGGNVSFILNDDLSEGHVSGDKIKIEQIRTDVELYVSANGDESNPTWVEVDNDTEVQFSPNTARLKLNLTNYPAAREVDITLN